MSETVLSGVPEAELSPLMVLHRLPSPVPLLIRLHPPHHDHYLFSSLFHVLELEIDIDIKPGSFPNSINPNSNGKIPVAILTTDIFDATTVDRDTVRFGPGEAAPLRWAVEDVDGDGDLDLVFHFKTRETGIAPGDTEATLIGETFDGVAVEGTDSVRMVPPGS